MNIATKSMNYMTKILRSVDSQYKKMATEPYGQRKATPQEQRQMYDNLTEGELYTLIQEHGIDSVQKWLYKMEQGGKNATRT